MNNSTIETGTISSKRRRKTTTERSSSCGGNPKQPIQFNCSPNSNGVDRQMASKSPGTSQRCRLILQQCLAIQLSKPGHAPEDFWMYDSGYMIFQVSQCVDLEFFLDQPIWWKKSSKNRAKRLRKYLDNKKSTTITANTFHKHHKNYSLCNLNGCVMCNNVLPVWWWFISPWDIFCCCVAISWKDNFTAFDWFSSLIRASIRKIWNVIQICLCSILRFYATFTAWEQPIYVCRE